MFILPVCVPTGIAGVINLLFVHHLVALGNQVIYLSHLYYMYNYFYFIDKGSKRDVFFF